MFNIFRYPYSDFEKINLDWILHRLSEIDPQGNENPVSYDPQSPDASEQAQARSNLGLGSAALENVPIAIDKGGTGADNLADAKTNLGIPSQVSDLPNDAGYITSAYVPHFFNFSTAFMNNVNSDLTVQYVQAYLFGELLFLTFSVNVPAGGVSGAFYKIFDTPTGALNTGSTAYGYVQLGLNDVYPLCSRGGTYNDVCIASPSSININAGYLRGFIFWRSEPTP